MARRKRSEIETARRFALALAVLLAVFAALSLWRGHGARALAWAVLGMAAPGLAFGLPAVWLPIFRAWMKLAVVISGIVTRVILTVFYFALFTPFCVVLRLFGVKTIDADFRREAGSYWIDREPPEATIERYRKQW